MYAKITLQNSLLKMLFTQLLLLFATQKQITAFHLFKIRIQVVIKGNIGRECITCSNLFHFCGHKLDRETLDRH